MIVMAGGTRIGSPSVERSSAVGVALYVDGGRKVARQRDRREDRGKWSGEGPVTRTLPGQSYSGLIVSPAGRVVQFFAPWRSSGAADSRL